MTAIYYSANVEREPFARNIRTAVLRSLGTAEIVSVTQLPIDLPNNIVVGDVGVSGLNSVRQLQIGITEARTEYICTVEADTLYPPEYFSFNPPSDEVMYLAGPTWLAFVRNDRKYYSLKGVGFEGALVSARDTILKSVDAWLAGMPMWSSYEEHETFVQQTPWRQRRVRRKPFYWYWPHDRFTLPTPVLSFKTTQNMHYSTRHTRRTNREYLEPFGHIEETYRRWCLSPIHID